MTDPDLLARYRQLEQAARDYIRVMTLGGFYSGNGTLLTGRSFRKIAAAFRADARTEGLETLHGKETWALANLCEALADLRSHPRQHATNRTDCEHERIIAHAQEETGNG